MLILSRSVRSDASGHTIISLERGRSNYYLHVAGARRMNGAGEEGRTYYWRLSGRTEYKQARRNVKAWALWDLLAWVYSGGKIDRVKFSCRPPPVCLPAGSRPA